jgi:hypothetical protein
MGYSFFKSARFLSFLRTQGYMIDCFSLILLKGVLKHHFLVSTALKTKEKEGKIGVSIT